MLGDLIIFRTRIEIKCDAWLIREACFCRYYIPLYVVQTRKKEEGSDETDSIYR
jgi:hypothetical protein